MVLRTSEYKFNIQITIPVRLEKMAVMPVLLYRWIRYGYVFRRIRLTQGKYAIVDPDDYFKLNRYKWYANRDRNTFYALRKFTQKDGKRRNCYMHREVIKVPDKMFVDHINRNGLDNRKANLRPATVSQNARNCAKNKSRTFCSKFKGVTWHRGKKYWQAQIVLNQKYIYLGSFKDEVQAAKAYDKAAKKYHGEFAALNFAEKRRLIFRIQDKILNAIVERIIEERNRCS